MATMLPLALLMLGTCGTEADTGDPPVARAYDRTLHWSDLRNAVPVGVTTEDSAAMAQRFINNWLHQQVVLYKAEQNLDQGRMDLQAQLRDYRNSLVIYAYEQALVEQKLDTSVTGAEIERYHEENRAAFELQDDIQRVRWSKVRDDDRRTMKRLEDHFLSGDPGRMREVEIWLAQRGIPIVDRSATWTTRTELKAEVPIDDEKATAAGRTVVKRDGTTWFVDLLEVRSKGSLPPVELVRQDIRAILINQRKLQLIEGMRQDLYREAVERKDIEVL